VVMPDGSIAAELPRRTADVMVVEVPLSSTVTPAVVIGHGLEWGVVMLALGALIGAALGPRRRPSAG
jgi:apolipoprotein N-acyltransferase